MKMNGGDMNGEGMHVSEPSAFDLAHIFGHITSGSFFLLCSLTYLSILASRYKQNPQAFSNSMPEDDHNLMRRFAVVFGSICFVFTIIEGIGGMLDGKEGFLWGFGFQLAHQVLYSSFTLVALSLYYESQGRLPLDTWRLSLVLAFVVSYLLWMGHAHMQDTHEEETFHVLLANLNMATAFTFTYSIYAPKNISILLISYGLMTLQGMWLYTMVVVLYSGLGLDIEEGRISFFFGAEVLFCALTGLLICKGLYVGDGVGEGKGFARVNSRDDCDDECDREGAVERVEMDIMKKGACCGGASVGKKKGGGRKECWGGNGSADGKAEMLDRESGSVV